MVTKSDDGSAPRPQTTRSEPGDPNGDVPPNAADKTVAEVLGEIVWLMSQSAEHKHHTIADLEWMVMPAILLRQFRTFYKEGRPVAVVLYARVSDAGAAKIAAGERLTPAEWRSGEIVRIVATVAPFGGAEAFAAQLASGEPAR